MVRLLAFLTAALGCRIYEEEVSMRKKSQRTGRSWMEMAAGSWSYTWVVPARSLGSTGSLVCPRPPVPHRVPTAGSARTRRPMGLDAGPTPQPDPRPTRAPDPITSISSLPGCPKTTSAFSSGCNFPRSSLNTRTGYEVWWPGVTPARGSELRGLTPGFCWACRPAWSQPRALTKVLWWAQSGHLLPWPLPLHRSPRGSPVLK